VAALAIRLAAAHDTDEAEEAFALHRREAAVLAAQKAARAEPERALEIRQGELQ
jgi:hypothetical protein